MTTSTSPKLTQNAYDTLLFELIVYAEESGDPKERVYTDDKGIPTIGVGFNLRVGRNIRFILSAILGEDWDILLPAQRDALELEIQTLAEKTDWPKNKTSGSFTAFESQVKTIFEKEEYGLSADATFEFPDEDSIKSVFNDLSPNYQAEVTNILTNLGGHSLDIAPELSKEHAVLVSLHYTSVFGKSPLLKAALKDGNRTKAWYEIRYQSNGGASPLGGVAKRKYFESQAFGVFRDGNAPTEEEKAELVKFLVNDNGTPTTQLTNMLAYEKKWMKYEYLAAKENPTDYDGLLFGEVLSPIMDDLLTKIAGDDYNLEELIKIGASINGDFVLGVETQHSSDSQVNIQPTYRMGLNKSPKESDPLPAQISGINDLLLALNGKSYVMQGLWGDDVVIGGDKADKLYGDYIDSRSDMEGGNDILIGGGGNDELYGAAGDDYLDGGTGADKMVGGKGDDTYLVDNINDQIIEEDDEGTDTLKSTIEILNLDVNIENAELLESADINLYGNDSANELKGNKGINHIYGKDGDDTLNGGDDQVVDYLHGGFGEDTYIVAKGDIIDDPDGRGSITYNGHVITFGDAEQVSEDSNIYRSRDGTSFTFGDDGSSKRICWRCWW